MTLIFIIIRLIFIFLLGYFIYYLYRKLWKNKAEISNNNKTNKNIKPEEMKQDPVCKTYVPISQAIVYTDKNKKLYFCSEKCKKKYNQN